MKLIITCEHGGNVIPKTYQKYFGYVESVLNTHRGYDLGALDLFNTLQPLADFTLYSETSRLLIELNRSLHHPNLFSEFTKTLSNKEKETLIQSYYLPYRHTVEKTIKDWISKNETVLHLSIHSFTPILNHVKRKCDIGLLYDSRTFSEKAFCSSFKKEINLINASLRVRYNYPYSGRSDGFTTYLRKQFKTKYLGIEIEVNQKYAIENKMHPKIKQAIYTALKSNL